MNHSCRRRMYACSSSGGLLGSSIHLPGVLIFAPWANAGAVLARRKRKMNARVRLRAGYRDMQLPFQTEMLSFREEKNGHSGTLEVCLWIGQAVNQKHSFLTSNQHFSYL